MSTRIFVLDVLSPSRSLCSACIGGSVKKKKFFSLSEKLSAPSILSPQANARQWSETLLILSKTYQFRNGAQPFEARGISCNQMRQSTIIWMLTHTQIIVQSTINPVPHGGRTESLRGKSWGLQPGAESSVVRRRRLTFSCVIKPDMPAYTPRWNNVKIKK